MRQFVQAARALADAERAGQIEATKSLLFVVNRHHCRRSRSGYQVVLGNICCGWETGWGLSSAENRCPVCGWAFVDRPAPKGVIKNGSDKVFFSQDGFLVVYHDVMDRLVAEGMTGLQFVPVQDPDAGMLTVSAYSGSFEGNRRRLIDEFPAFLRSSGAAAEAPAESVRILSRAIEEAVEKQRNSKAVTGVEQEAAWIRLPPSIQHDPVFVAFHRFLTGFERREMMSLGVYPPPSAGYASKWYALVPDEPSVPEPPGTKHDTVTACPECGRRPALEGPLVLRRQDVEGRSIANSDSGWTIASDDVCLLLHEYAHIGTASVRLLE